MYYADPIGGRFGPEKSNFRFSDAISAQIWAHSASCFSALPEAIWTRSRSFESPMDPLSKPVPADATTHTPRSRNAREAVGVHASSAATTDTEMALRIAQNKNSKQNLVVLIRRLISNPTNM